MIKVSPHKQVQQEQEYSWLGLDVLHPHQVRGAQLQEIKDI